MMKLIFWNGWGWKYVRQNPNVWKFADSCHRLRTNGKNSRTVHLRNERLIIVRNDICETGRLSTNNLSLTCFSKKFSILKNFWLECHVFWKLFFISIIVSGAKRLRFPGSKTRAIGIDFLRNDLCKYIRLLWHRRLRKRKKIFFEVKIFLFSF